jgi:hypothetical protein
MMIFSKIKTAMVILTACLALAVSFSAVAPVYADAESDCGNAGGAWSGGKCDCTGAPTDKATKCNLVSGTAQATTGGPSDLPAVIKNIVQVMMFIVGTLSVIMLIYGGIKYTTSAGDTAKVTSAKNTIMYSIVGLVVAILAYAIIGFVTANIT